MNQDVPGLGSLGGLGQLGGGQQGDGLATVARPGAAGLGATIGIALSNAHRIMQQQALEKQQKELQQLQIQAYKQKVGTQMFSQMYDQINGSGGALAADPALLKKARDIEKTTGVKLPTKTDEHGNTVIDYQALRPRNDFNTWTPEQQIAFKQKVLATPEGPDRDAMLAGVDNAPTELKAAKQYVPLGAGSETEVIKDLIGPNGQVAQFKAGKTDPIAFSASINALHSIAPNIDVSQFQTPEFLNSGTSAWAQTQMDWMHERGIHLKNEDQVRAQMEKDRAAEAAVRATLTREQLVIRDREFQQRQAQLWQTHIDNLGVANQRLALQAQGLQSLMGNRAVMQQIAIAGAAFKPVADLRAQYNSANSLLTQVTEKIGAITAANPGQPPPKELQDRYDALSKTVTEVKDQLKYFENIAQSSVDSATSGIAGAPTRGVKPPVTTPNPQHPDTSDQPGKGRYLTTSALNDIAKQQGWTPAEARSKAEALGYTIR